MTAVLGSPSGVVSAESQAEIRGVGGGGGGGELSEKLQRERETVWQRLMEEIRIYDKSLSELRM